MNYKPPLIGVAWMILYCLCEIVTDGTIKYIIISDLPMAQVLFMRALLGAMILLPFVLRDKSSISCIS